MASVWLAGDRGFKSLRARHSRSLLCLAPLIYRLNLGFNFKVGLGFFSEDGKSTKSDKS